MKIPEIEIDEAQLMTEIKAAIGKTALEQVWYVVREYQIERLVRERASELAKVVIDELVTAALRDSEKLKAVVEDALKRKIADKLQKERAKLAKEDQKVGQ
jgi:hypothetical protein